MAQYPSFREAAEKGFVFPEARAWIGQPGMAQDAALITTANTLVPVELTAYIDPRVVTILTAVRNARALFPEVQLGDWTTAYDKWAVEEMTGATQPYTDYADGVTSGSNFEWMSREQYIFQTTVTYGDLEADKMAKARINLASSRQISAANTLDIDGNKFALLGVSGKSIYGVLNDPNLPSATAVSSWKSATAEQIYNSINTNLFGALAENSGGHITYDSKLKLALSAAMNEKLGVTNSYGKTVLGMLREVYTDLTIVILPELSNMTAGETVFMVAEEVDGQKVAELGFGVKMRAGRLVPQLSSWAQKFVSSTYGGIVYKPFAVASITGVDA